MNFASRSNFGKAKNPALMNHLVYFSTDFGLADYYVNRKTKAVKRFRLGRSFAGTLKFMSTAASMAMQYSPADDLYEIGYTLVALLYGRLPWQDAAEIKEKRQRVLQTTKMKFITTHQVSFLELLLLDDVHQRLLNYRYRRSLMLKSLFFNSIIPPSPSHFKFIS